VQYFVHVRNEKQLNLLPVLFDCQAYGGSYSDSVTMIMAYYHRRRPTDWLLHFVQRSYAYFLAGCRIQPLPSARTIFSQNSVRAIAYAVFSVRAFLVVSNFDYLCITNIMCIRYGPPYIQYNGKLVYTTNHCANTTPSNRIHADKL